MLWWELYFNFWLFVYGESWILIWIFWRLRIELIWRIWDLLELVFDFLVVWFECKFSSFLYWIIFVIRMVGLLKLKIFGGLVWFIFGDFLVKFWIFFLFVILFLFLIFIWFEFLNVCIGVFLLIVFCCLDLWNWKYLVDRYVFLIFLFMIFDMIDGEV